MSSAFAPHVTVATIVCRVVDGATEFLCVKEHTPQGIRINQPAGHWEPGESLVEAAVRETREETGWAVEITGFVSVTSLLAANGETYLRFTFAAKALGPIEGALLDPEIIEPLWLTQAQLDRQKSLWRSPLVGDVIAQYQRLGEQPLELVTHGR
ncbi:NUDIX domain-containing protein [Simiduia sp. 21SJ11W-1]|uniref:NUDIX domain-containing protein n=1 Tax=Simiduia sp. 21SJ11W-1 TaxID=2909669 RepID=UPI00209EEA3C|nr:NUDIX domain-containing protein [Simiduia sp. 21SJ11W-1]UTA49589.1 NUDIX domain-containing protein [Simiduia sp. 21SJ11W-1]